MDSEYGGSYRLLYQNHWWWRARERILRATVARLSLPSRPSILDFGCGDGLAFPMLREFGEVCGIEVDVSLLDPANPDRSAIRSAPLASGAYGDERHDLITALDAIEHIEDDAGTLRQLFAMLRPGGFLLLTVPACMSLWDEHDEINRHFRRYSRQALQEALPASAELVELRFLFASLFPPKWLLARFNRLRRRKIGQHGIPAPALNGLLESWCVLEDRLMRRLRPAFGTSLLALLRCPRRA
ncbi:MAG: class I SAM-dependent methyltransferase [Xanthomonadales bacterium]|nr:hypothetical protein [Xanthomonadales bacterium]MCC6594443.1 class I SAM-dependent methyltransferase [Xanthomonadales bacterium]MCE7932498.1 class I SAM-dependent methyltransferase [Xanthomonadales bacterium PRO6]